MGLKVLVISTHMDDAELGCGGSIHKHIVDGDRVIWHTMIGDGYGKLNDILKSEFISSMKVMGVDEWALHNFKKSTFDISELRDCIYQLWQMIMPDIAYIPWPGSRHPEHRAVGTSAVQVSWASNTEIYAYTVPNDIAGFVPNTFSVLDEEAVIARNRAISQYESQFRLRSWFSWDIFDAYLKVFSINGRETEPLKLLRKVRWW